MDFINAKNATLVARLGAAGITATPKQAQILRRAEIVLREWQFHVKGIAAADGRTISIVRRERDSAPFIHMTGPEVGFVRYRIPDREKTALTRVTKVCAELGLSSMVKDGNLTVAKPGMATTISCRV